MDRRHRISGLPVAPRHLHVRHRTHGRAEKIGSISTVVTRQLIQGISGHDHDPSFFHFQHFYELVVVLLLLRFLL